MFNFGWHSTTSTCKSDFLISLTSIEGQISNEGVVKFLLDSPKLNFKESFELPRRFDLTGEVHFKIKYFIYRSELLAMNQKT
ncbi:hypothetical protein, partial [Escherichia coli]|uniref:hypothetical protein n=1 Tax=Escherichia coli TaxID=562 RepID=UPI00200F5736